MHDLRRLSACLLLASMGTLLRERAALAKEKISADFISDVSTGCPALPVHFTDRSYTNVPGGPTTWAWDFENDGVVDSTQRNPTHTFPLCGRYAVSLRVTDGVHAASTTVRTDCIVIDAISADFTTQVIGPNTVSFTDTSVPPATARSWDLDGDHVVDAFGASVVHVYPAGSGPVAVTLTASRLCGAPATRTRNVLPTPGLVTTFAGGNGLGGSGAGNLFDLEVLNPLGINVTALTTSTAISATVCASGIIVNSRIFTKDARRQAWTCARLRGL